VPETDRMPKPDFNHIHDDVQRALAEDIGSGDITAQLIPNDTLATAHVISREPAILCGQDWFDATFRQLTPQITVDWHCAERDAVTPETVLCTLHGPARALLTGERTALNFLQTLSGTATRVHRAVQLLKPYPQVQLLDTRKTLPGLRLAQKYAVTAGGGHNHRLGLYDAFLIKENHIAACGSITAAVAAARRIAPGKPVEVEVETLDELREALHAQADIVMLDNFALAAIREAAALNQRRAKLEVSGNVDDAQLITLAATGIDYISMGGLTKHITAIDLSMRIIHRDNKPHAAN
jgi:nicotinate-nucleotide pyrophosphorylase (carboxylating)